MVRSWFRLLDTPPGVCSHIREEAATDPEYGFAGCPGLGWVSRIWLLGVPDLVGCPGIVAILLSITLEGAAMKVQSLGHVVIKVTDLERSEKFYNGVLGMPVCARFDEQGMKMTFFSLGNHHDLALAQVSGEVAADDQAVGLHHVAFCIGDSVEQLREAKTEIEAAGFKPHPIDHDVTKSLYVFDPDGNNVELYVDVSDVWREDPQRIAKVAPLDL